MSIDTGLNLTFNANYPLPNVDQSSQQFRDNFAVIKAATEALQSATSGNTSIANVAVSVTNTGAAKINLSFKDNSFTVPTGNPTVTASTGMIRYDTASGALQFHNGSGWRTVVFKDGAGLVTLDTLTVNTRLTLNFTASQASDAVRYSMLQAETTARQNGDTNLQNQVNVLTAGFQDVYDRANAATETTDFFQDYVDQGDSNEANARMAADSAEANARVLGDANEANARTAADAALDSRVTALEGSSNSVQKTGDTMTGDLTLTNTADLILNGGNATVSNGVLSLVNSDFQLPGSNITIDADHYLFWTKIPNTYGIGDGAFITYSENNFQYAYNANSANLEYSCMVIGTTNDSALGEGGDSMALEPCADLWLNPGWQGGPNSNGPREARGNSRVFVGNATNIVATIYRDNGNMNIAGAFTAGGDVTAFSDIALKYNIETIPSALAKVEMMRGVTYNRVDLPDNPKQMGVIAQEIREIVPEVVRENENGILSVAYGNLVGVLIEAVKELSAEVKELKSRLP